MTMSPDPLRVLHVITSTDAGGAERMLRRTLRAMRDRRAPRVASRVACVKPLGPVGEQLLAEGFEVESLGSPAPGRGPSAAAFPLREARTLLALRRCVTAFAPHVVQTWLPRADLLGRLAALGTGARVVSSVRVIDLDRDWAARLDGLTRGLVDGWLAVSEAAADHHARVSGIPRERFTVVPNALEDEETRLPSEAPAARARLGLDPGAFLVVAVARLHPQKGLATLLDAVASLRGDGERARPVALVVAGDGPQRAELEERARRLGIEAAVRFAGVIPDARLLVGAADAFVLPSVFEGMPGALLEAMALGRACVATAIPGTLEVARDGEHALLVPPRDPPALAAALRRLRDDEALRARLGEAARARVLAEFRMERNAERVLALWTSVLR